MKRIRPQHSNTYGNSLKVRGTCLASQSVPVVLPHSCGGSYSGQSNLGESELSLIKLRGRPKCRSVHTDTLNRHAHEGET